MGEKVYVSGEEVRSSTSPQPAEPLSYADRHVPRRMDEYLRGVANRLGGWPQIVFAVGLATTLSAFMYAVTTHMDKTEAAFFGFVGGLMIGLVIRVPLRRD